MSLYSALSSSVTGMAAQANKLTAVSENISNSSTTGYKTASTDFEDLISQTPATAQFNGGGVTSSVSYNIAEQGDLNSTTSQTDLAIQGNGFFLVNDSSGATYLTRAGSFTPDSSGNLVNGAGYTLMGYDISPGGAGVTNSMSGLTEVNINAASLTATPSTAGTLTVNLPSTIAGTGTSTGGTADPASPTNYDEKTSVVSYDNLGDPITLNVYLSKTVGSTNTWQAAVYNNADLTTPLTTGTLNFSSTDGTLSSGSPLTFAIPGGNSNVTLDMSKTTQLASAFAVSTDTMDGNAPSALKSVAVDTDGTLSFVYASGQEVAAYQIPLGNVESPTNLTSLSGDVFQASTTSGNIVIGTAGTGGLGSIKSGELEASTVDLASQLTDMIQAQRGYEANSKVFQAGSDLLSELINILK